MKRVLLAIVSDDTGVSDLKVLEHHDHDLGLHCVHCEHIMSTLRRDVM